jgi:hypothetical protein
MLLLLLAALHLCAELHFTHTTHLCQSSSSSSSGAVNNNSSSSSSSGYTAAFFAQHGSASPSTAPTSPPLHSGAAAAASSSDVNSAAVEVITTALNFEGSVRTVLPVGGHWDELLRELLRHCSVTVGRSVELLYLSADGRRHVPLCEQDDLRYVLYLYTTSHSTTVNSARCYLTYTAANGAELHSILLM